MTPRSIREPWGVSQDELTPEEIVRKHLANYPLYKPDQPVFSKEDKNNIYLNWCDDPLRQMDRTTCFDAQVIDKTFYLLHIEVNKQYRGKGYGLLLYLLLEEIAKDLGCHTIEQTPSGCTPGKETRMKYVCRKLGYEPKGIVAASKNICPDGLLPDGVVCPRCGKRRGPSGINGGTWVHF